MPQFVVLAGGWTRKSAGATGTGRSSSGLNATTARVTARYFIDVLAVAVIILIRLSPSDLPLRAAFRSELFLTAPFNGALGLEFALQPSCPPQGYHCARTSRTLIGISVHGSRSSGLWFGRHRCDSAPTTLHRSRCANTGGGRPATRDEISHTMRMVQIAILSKADG